MKIYTLRILCPLIMVLLLFCGISSAKVYSGEEIRREVISFIRSAGYGDRIDAGVKVSLDEYGLVSIVDKGDYFIQYLLVGPKDAKEAQVQVSSSVKILPSCDKIVVAVHGWIDKAEDSWPADIAMAIKQKVDPNEWVCGYFDWHRGARVTSPIDAAKYARDIGGVRLGRAILKLSAKGQGFKHVHLIGHSAGSWAIDSAAKMLAESNKSLQVHLTFLDAYVPPDWPEGVLGDIGGKNISMVEHYYTADFTFKSTQSELPKAHNVDITAVDPWFKEHRFPYRWYLATITGQYGLWKMEKSEKVISSVGGIEYGFARSAEAGQNNWLKSLTLKRGNKGVKMIKEPRGNKKKWFNLDLLK